MLFDQGISIPESVEREGLSVSLLDETFRISIRARAKDRTAINKAAGLKLPAKIGQTNHSGGVLAACLGPEEWLVITAPKAGEKLFAKLVKLSAKQLMSVTDVSHRNLGFMISGEKAVALVNVGCPLDLRGDAFAVGKFTRTVFESCPITLYRAEEQTFIIECWRSYGDYMRDFITRAAADL